MILLCQQSVAYHLRPLCCDSLLFHIKHRGAERQCYLKMFRFQHFIFSNIVNVSENDVILQFFSSKVFLLSSACCISSKNDIHEHTSL